MLDKAEDYLIRSGECVVLGNFTDEVTVLGVAGQFAMGFFDLDMPCDIRDIIADVKNLAQADEIKWDMIAMLALDLIGVIPVIGALKYSDEIGTLFKNADKVSVVARSTDGTGVLAIEGGKAVSFTQKNVGAPILPEGSQWERNVLNSFAGGKATQTTYEGGTVLYRVGGKNGGFWNLEAPPMTEYQWRVDYAIKQPAMLAGELWRRFLIW